MAYSAATALKRASIGFRMRLPRVVRDVYRSGRSLTERSSLSVQIPEALVAHATLCATRFSMLTRLPAGGVVAELGTDRGEFARAILDTCRPERLHIVDIALSRLPSCVADHPAVVLHGGLTQNAAASFEDASLDWVYVDAGHDYASVMADARAFAEKIKPGGYLVFNDFAHIDHELGRYGVHRAVSEFCVDRQWPIAYFALHPAALYDVALRKPDEVVNGREAR